MADITLLFDELLKTTNLRAKTYVVYEDKDAMMACIELRARRGEDWFFARRWVGFGQGRRFLYWLLDDIESHGYRFQIHQVPHVLPTQTSASDQPWALASTNWAALTEEERRIHRDLFPQEEALLRHGYDWDHTNVYRDGEPLPRDRYGRVMEEREGVVYEWVRIVDEYAWRRYPLYVLPSRMRASVAPATPEHAA